jgi:hypothetical protein
VVHNVWVGANGYYLRQIRKPSINGVQLTDSPEQVGAIGPGAVWNLPHLFLFANAYHEVGVVSRPKGNKMVLRVVWVLGQK